MNNYATLSPVCLTFITSSVSTEVTVNRKTYEMDYRGKVSAPVDNYDTRWRCHKCGAQHRRETMTCNQTLQSVAVGVGGAQISRKGAVCGHGRCDKCQANWR